MGFVDDIKNALGLGPEWIEPYNWSQRIGQAAYTPPSGLRITFDFEDLSHRFGKKTSVWNFPGANGAYIQDKGLGPRRFPMRCFFWGYDCDKEANVFETALMEKGVGTLEHPMYGRFDVVPFGEITRRDNLKTEANQVVVEVEFYNTIGATYLYGVQSPIMATLAALINFGQALLADFATSTDQGTILEAKSLLDQINDAIDMVGNQLDKIAAVQNVINDQFNDIVDTLNNAIDTFVRDPLMIANMTKQMIQAPARAMASISDRLEAYGNLAQDIYSKPDSVSGPGGPGGMGPIIDRFTGEGNNAEEPNKFHVRDLVAQCALSGSILSVLYTTTDTGSAGMDPDIATKRLDAENQGIVSPDSKFTTTAQALTAADKLFAQLEELSDWREENFESIAGGNLTEAERKKFISAPTNMDTGNAFGFLQRAVALAAGFLIETSFSLQKERRINLDRPRALPELLYELYGDVDEHMDFFIQSNKLTGSEILELPMGREIVYYV